MTVDTRGTAPPGHTDSGLASLLRAEPLDRLGLVTLLACLYFFQVWALTIPGSPIAPGLHLLLMALSGIGILLPRLTSVLVINACAFAVFYLANAPNASNNQLTGFFFSLVVLGAAVLLRPADRPGGDRDALFQKIAVVGCWLLPGMYFFGIYHKINADFLDPTVSCAVVLYRALAGEVGLADLRLGHYGAIYATFAIEAIAMIALFIPRLKYFGMMVAIPFHIVIGFTGYAYYKDFSTIVLVLYALFLPREAVDNALARMSAVLGSRERALLMGRGALLFVVVLYVASTGLLANVGRAIPTDSGFMPFFALYALGFYAFVMIAMPRDGGTPLAARAGWLLIVPILYFLNGWSPYIGLKTESSIAMFSNLHTEGGQTNHLLHGVIPGTFGYQNDIVTPVASNSPGFDAAFVETPRALVRYEFDRLLAQTPGLQVTLRTQDGGTVTTSEDWTNTYLDSGAIARRFLIFKPVDFARPKVCTH